MTIEVNEGFTYQDHQAGPLDRWYRTVACCNCRNTISYTLEDEDPDRIQREIAGHVHAPPGYGWNGLPLRALSVITFGEWLSFMVAYWRQIPGAQIAAVPQLLPLCRALAEVIDSTCDEADEQVDEAVSVTCPMCKTTTYNADHAMQGYCAFCRAYTQPPTSEPEVTGEFVQRLMNITLGELLEHKGVLPEGAVGVRWVSHEQCVKHAAETVNRTQMVLGETATGLVLYEDTLVGPLECADCTVERPILDRLPVPR